MSGYRVMHWSLCCLAVAVGVAGCASDTTSGETTGSLSLNLEVGNVDIDAVDYLITGNGMEPMGGTIDTSAPGSTASVEVFGLLPGNYTVRLSATATDEETMCEGSEDFPVKADELTSVMVYLRCKLPETLGGVRVNGKFNVCAVVKESVVKPLQTSVGNDIELSAMGEDAEGDNITYIWTGTGGSIDEPKAMDTTYTCEEAGHHTVTITVSDDGFEHCMDSWTTVVTCVGLDGPECVEDADCGLGEVCNDNNQCVPEVECNDDQDCDTGFVCENFECVRDVECNDDQDCDTGFVCENFECVPDVECNENDDCEPGDICHDNVCRSDPDLFCDTGLCVEDTVLRGECVGAFLLCLADEVDEEECVLLSIAICTECNTDLDCGDLEICTANECVAVDCKMDGDCDDQDDCTSNACVANNCVHSAEPVGTVCGNDGQCTSGGACTEGACTNSADSNYVCNEGAVPPTMKTTLTACGLCEREGFACPSWCDGTVSPAYGPASVCGANILLLGGNGGACLTGLSAGCLTCYTDYARCGPSSCPAQCTVTGPTGAVACSCYDCVNTNCEAAFATCAGYLTGRPNGTPSATGGVVGGPPVCQGIGTPDCDE